METNKKRGAPYGNTNALKHGFYSRAFNRIDIADLERVNNGLEDEIVLLRVCTKRLIEMSNNIDNKNEMMTNLNTIGLAVIRISHLLRTNKLLAGSSDSVAEILNKAISQITREMGI
jgi:hypothetical protein